MRKKKGEYGYRNYRKAVQLGQVLFGAAAIVIQLLARNLTDNQAAKNVLTLMAILSVLPTANVAAPLLAALRYRTPSEDFHKKAAGYESKGVLLYDLVVTTKEQILPFDAVMIHPMGVIAYCPAEKTDIKKAEKTLNASFVSQKLDPNIRIITDERQFFNRLKGLKPAADYEDDGSVGYAAGVLKSMSM